MGFRSTRPLRPILASFHRRALLEIQRRKLDIVNSRFDRPFIDAEFNQKRQLAVSFCALADQFVAERVEDAEINRRARKTVDKLQYNLALIREIVGEQTLVS